MLQLAGNSSHYICGPAGLKESVKKALTVKNVNPSAIFSGDFELVKTPKNFEHIHTQTVTVNFLGAEHRIEVVKGNGVLEAAALYSDIELPYSCQTGRYSICKGKVTNGDLKIIGLIKQREDLSDGEYLLCCSHPLSENVYIEI